MSAVFIKVTLAEGTMDQVQAHPVKLNKFISENRMLEVKSVNQYYGESHTLWDLDMQIPEGKCTVLMGRNGVE